MFLNVKDDGSFDESAQGTLRELKEKDIFKTLKLEYPFEG